ncbi:MAG: ATP-binding protein [Planctomycetes bacterium]|nr:ATP-binding protein [Planctomycetota bacterium]
MAQKLQLPVPLVGPILEELRKDQFLDVLGAAGPLGYRYSVSARGREYADRVAQVCGYVGPVPVSLEAYRALLNWQQERFPAITPADVEPVLNGLVLPPSVEQVAGMALASGRSLFISGSPGNGKTALARRLHTALRGDLWIPYSIAVDDTLIRVFDPQCHTLADFAPPQPWLIDQRWVRIRRPLIVVGGELTIEALDLAYHPAQRYYEAPAHLKSNGGVLLIDDFGRQRVAPFQLLNRWIIPLEQQIDYLTLHDGQKIEVPFLQMLIFATNLNPQEVTDPAFLRRMGYRLWLSGPSTEAYANIFRSYAASVGMTCDASLLPHVLARYQHEGRELRGCEPRDLIERARDYCRFQGKPEVLDQTTLDIAWNGYFGT